MASIYTGFSDTDCNDLLNYWFQGSLLSTVDPGADHHDHHLGLDRRLPRRRRPVLQDHGGQHLG